MRTVLGIDGGGTRTRAVIVDEAGRLRGAGSAGPANYHSVGLDAAIANIVAAASEAIRQGGLPADQRCDAAFLGLAGCGTDEDRIKLAAVAQRLPMVAPPHVIIDHDLRIAHGGALEGDPGVVLIAGTGSACFGVDRHGKTARAGGWGPMFDDFGGAFDIGRRAITHAIFVADGRAEPSMLAAGVTEALGGDLRAAVKLTVTGDDRNRIAGLASLVFEAAGRGEPFASAIIMACVDELARCVAAVVSKLRFDAEIDVVVLGGLNNAGRGFFQPLYDAIRRRVPQAQIVSEMLPAALGAAILALRSLGVEVTVDVLSAMKKVKAEVHADVTAR